jgi:hypothetical protein
MQQQPAASSDSAFTVANWENSLKWVDLGG